MITLFRRIRQKLIDSGSVTRYLLYATGEIALVMIGILLALQVSNWNQEKNDKAIAREYVQLLQTDLKADTTMLQTLIEESLRKHDDAQSLMKLYYENVNEFEDTLSILRAIQDIGRTNSPSFRNNTYNDLVNTGNIKLLEEREIIDALMTYYTTDFSDWREEYIHRLWREYLPHAIDMLPSEFLEDIVKNDSGSEIEMVLEKYVPDNDPGLPDEIIAAFRENTEMEFLLKSVSRTHLVHVFFLKTTKDLANAALASLESAGQDS